MMYLFLIAAIVLFEQTIGAMDGGETPSYDSDIAHLVITIKSIENCSLSARLEKKQLRKHIKREFSTLKKDYEEAKHNLIKAQAAYVNAKTKYKELRTIKEFVRTKNKSTKKRSFQE